jgi:quinol monooxygenase YgiN
MVTTALIARMAAKPGRDEEVAAFLAAGLAIVEDEPETLVWLALRDGASFTIVDAFLDDAGRRAHLDGPLAAALLDRADELLAGPPEIVAVEVLAAKLP